jgi:hypothetical protein
MVVLLEGSPISTEELWSTVRLTSGFLVSSLTKALLPQLLSLARWPALRRVIVVLNFFHLRMMEPNVFLGTFNAVAENYGQFLRPHGMVFVLTCSVNCETLYRQVCAFPNNFQSIKFTIGRLQSSCRNISWMINGNGCTRAQF